LDDLHIRAGVCTGITTTPTPRKATTTRKSLGKPRKPNSKGTPVWTPCPDGDNYEEKTSGRVISNPKRQGIVKE